LEISIPGAITHEVGHAITDLIWNSQWLGMRNADPNGNWDQVREQQGQYFRSIFREFS